MCLVVYIASSEPLPANEWKHGLGVTITNLDPKDNGIQKQFTYPHVYYVASSEGCGCGFLTHYKDGEDLEQALNERRALSTILLQNSTSKARFQLLVAYSGYERNEIDWRWKSSLEDLEKCDFNRGWDYHVILVEIDKTSPITIGASGEKAGIRKK